MTAPLVHQHRHRHARGRYRGTWHLHAHRHAQPRRHAAAASYGVGRRLADGPHQHGHRGSAPVLTARAE